MALGTLGTALATSAITSGASFGLSKLFGGSQKSPTAPLQNFQPLMVNAGGLRTSSGRHGVNVDVSPERTGLVGRIADSFSGLSNELAGLRSKVAPGISELRAARLAEIDNARTAAVGNLRENLQRRRVLGSSFGQDAITRAESEFAGQRERVAAESFMAELEATNNLLNQEFEARRASFQTGLNELNLQADLATKIASSATDQLGANARLESAMIAKENEGAGKFFGQLSQPVADAAGKFFGNALSTGSFGG